jgi:hypothetical protein
MPHVDSTRLYFGPNRTPRFHYGPVIMCEVRGEVIIKRLKDSPIPWPMGQRRGERAVGLIIYKDLARAIRTEAAVAVAHHWGVTAQTVTAWRKALGVEPTTLGTSELRRQQALMPAGVAALQMAQAKAGDPERRAKIAAARRGKPRCREDLEPAWAANRERVVTAETRRKMSEAHRQRGTRPPAAGRPWTAAEERLLRELPPAQVAEMTGRTLPAVYAMRRVLGLPDGRSIRA